MLAIWRAEQTSRHPVPGFQRLQWLAGIPDHNPAEYLNKSILEKTKVDTKQFEFFVDFVYDVYICWCCFLISCDFIFPDVSRCSVSALENENPRQATEAGRIVLAPSIAAIGLVGLLCAICAMWRNIVGFPRPTHLEYYRCPTDIIFGILYGMLSSIFGISYSNWDIFSMPHRFQVEYLWYPIYLEYYCIYLRISNIVEYIWISKIFGIL